MHFFQMGLFIIRQRIFDVSDMDKNELNFKVKVDGLVQAASVE